MKTFWWGFSCHGHGGTAIDAAKSRVPYWIPLCTIFKVTRLLFFAITDYFKGGGEFFRLLLDSV